MAPIQPPRILVVDDEAPIVELVRGYLEREGFDGRDGRGRAGRRSSRARRRRPTWSILDVMLPGLDGIEVCRQLRTFSDAYVLMLTARGEEIDRIVGLTVGADDYLVKPFSPARAGRPDQGLLRRPAGRGRAGDRGPARTRDRRGPPDRPRRRPAVDLTTLEFDLLAVARPRPGGR